MSEKGRSDTEEGRERRGFSPSPAPIPLTVTDRARDALEEILRVRPRGFVVHVIMVLGENPHPRLDVAPAGRGQLVFEQGGVPLVVDPESRAYLAGATIDHVIEDGFASFQIEGPNLPGPATGNSEETRSNPG